MRLAELQSALQSALDGAPCPELYPLIGSRRLPPERCLELYRQLQRKARLDSLRRLYPATARLLGPSHFERLNDLCTEQLAAGSESEPFGSLLPGLMDAYQAGEPALASFAFLAELALLEWQLHCASNARDDPDRDIDLEAWALLPEAQQLQMCPVPSHSLRLQHCRWPVAAIRDALLQGLPWQPALGQGGGWYCVHRHRDRLCIDAVSDEQARLIRGILNGHSLHRLSCDVPTLRHQLALMAARGWICRLRSATDDQAL